MTVTKWNLLDEWAAGQFLKLSVAALRRFRQHGHGPHWFTIPTGQIRYTHEDLEEWMATAGATLNVSPFSNVVALPGKGVRVRVRLPKSVPGAALASHRRYKPRNKLPKDTSKNPHTRAGWIKWRRDRKQEDKI